MRLHELPLPTIAAVNGVAAGAGCNLALGCDLIVASERARFAEIFAKRGLALDFGGSWVLPRLIGLHRAKELAFLAEIIDATEAERIGLVNRVVAHDQLAAEVATLAARLAAMPPLQLAVVKRQLNDGLGRTMAEALEAEAIAQSLMFTSRDSAEALIAFVQKARTPLHRRVAAPYLTRPRTRAAPTAPTRSNASGLGPRAPFRDRAHESGGATRRAIPRRRRKPGTTAPPTRRSRPRPRWPSGRKGTG